MLKRFVVKKNEKGVLLRDGDFERILSPGRHRFLDPLNRLTLKIWRQDSVMDDAVIAEYLLRHQAEKAEEHFVCMTLGENQAGLRYENDLPIEVLPPCARRFVWKGLMHHRLERFDLSQDAELPAKVTAQLNPSNLNCRGEERLESLLLSKGILLAAVPAYHAGVIKIDGHVERLLSPGLKAFWRFNRDIQFELVDTRLQNMEVSGQEILTKDRVSLRLNLAATWRYTNVRLAFATFGKPADHLYRELQFGLRAAVGTRTLDAILENKQSIDEIVTAHVTEKMSVFGIEIGSVGVRDIILPGEMRDILSRVVEAEKTAEANVIRRREETSATRALLNTAKVMEDNPVALRLKKLETLERVAERIDRISVFGGLDQVLNGLVTLKTE